MTEGQFINMVREFLGLEPLYHEKAKSKVSSVNTKSLTVPEVQRRIKVIQALVEEFDHEVAFSKEIDLMKDYIRQRAQVGDRRAAAIMTCWDIKFNRHCA